MESMSELLKTNLAGSDGSLAGAIRFRSKEKLSQDHKSSGLGRAIIMDGTLDEIGEAIHDSHGFAT